ncbi:hypothetical protein ST201phi2-1p099 [Pseudomonas phage 201phi2-1]|uniref:Uncharacterized protein n=1 Tax=Pseudomonas phage 201phi2-1 TaxID=198110 RepID=B3FIW3_BP201|nr:hypothetical protein ST201phi2-1p099 [Pseudomonas phage 201phi2-1]ABY62932.1 hypothetical protein 201phi2-1p099 [Pseudomonas phage 201phi2-1]
MEPLLSITRKAANAKITSEFLMRGNNIGLFRNSYARLQRKIREGSNIVAIYVNRKTA